MEYLVHHTNLHDSTTKLANDALSKHNLEAYGWEIVRSYHAAWLQHLEQSRATRNDSDKKLKLRRVLVWYRVTPPTTHYRRLNSSNCASTSLPALPHLPAESTHSRAPTIAREVSQTCYPSLHLTGPTRWQGMPRLQFKHLQRQFFPPPPPTSVCLLPDHRQAHLSRFSTILP